MATPLDYCEANDRQGVYVKARNGKLKGLAGIDEEYERPERADIRVDTSTQTIPEIVHSMYLRYQVESISLTTYC